MGQQPGIAPTCGRRGRSKYAISYVTREKISTAPAVIVVREEALLDAQCYHEGGALPRSTRRLDHAMSVACRRASRRQVAGQHGTSADTRGRRLASLARYPAELAANFYAFDLVLRALRHPDGCGPAVQAHSR